MRGVLTHVGQELGLVLACDSELLTFLLDLLEQAGIVDRDRRLRRKGFEQMHRFPREGASKCAADDQCTNHIVLMQKRDGKD